jgi:methylenetetrahydrofolate reductase (NADPH)
MSTRPTISLELFPPKDSAGEERLWSALTSLREISPDYVAVTYGAGGSTRDRTIRITSEITARTQLPTVAHLTCVGATRDELLDVLTKYKSAGITSILALRGDPQGGPSAPWVSTPRGFDHADQLVELAAEFGSFSIGVAAFPDGHPASQGNFSQEIDVLLRKEELGATFATTQFFFTASRYFDLVAKLRDRGSLLTVMPGVMPITNVKQVIRMTELSGTPIPTEVERKIRELENDPEAVRRYGCELATAFCKELLDGGAPGLHFYTMNTATSTKEIFQNLGI